MKEIICEIVASYFVMMAAFLLAAFTIDWVSHNRENWRRAIHLWACGVILRRDERRIRSAKRKLRKVSFAGQNPTIPAARRVRGSR